tara:strand:+ start:717 stop:923 length:207 start_codon:yes stop_codon:yes gene_type:complete
VYYITNASGTDRRAQWFHSVRVHKELRCDWRGGRTRQTQTGYVAFAISIGALTGEGEKCHEFDAEVEP